VSRRKPCGKGGDHHHPHRLFRRHRPRAAGIVPSLSRPGGNVTGINYMAAELGAKRQGLLHELAPRAARIALLVNTTNPVSAESEIRDVKGTAAIIGWRVDVFTAGTNRESETAFAALVQNGRMHLLSLPTRFSSIVACRS
jgi:ABC-type uncharacterized transport system substrate-binding protein